MAYVVVVAAIVVIAVVMNVLTTRQNSRHQGLIHTRSQPPLWTDTASELSAADMTALRRREEKFSNRRPPGYMTTVHTGDSSLLSDRLIRDNSSLRGQLRSGRFSDLKAQTEELAARSWAKSEVDWNEGFLLDPEKLDNITEPAEIVGALLNHAKRTTPEFSVPWLTPRTVIETTPAAAGQFVVEGGWVTIKLSPDFFGDRGAAQAILAHESCHYILNNSGFRKRDVALNERYTDICMFVCGFGKLFLDGYQKFPGQQYRPGHRLGYLSDMEYAFIYQYVVELRETYRDSLQSELAVLKQTLLHLVRGDHAMLKRLVDYERRRTPDKPEVGLYDNAITRLRRQ